MIVGNTSIRRDARVGSAASAGIALRSTRNIAT
jgi:hypothetical protein